MNKVNGTTTAEEQIERGKNEICKIYEVLLAKNLDLIILNQKSSIGRLVRGDLLRLVAERKWFNEDYFCSRCTFE